MKKFFLSILILLLVVVGASFVLPFLLTSDAVRQEFAKRVSSISGMDIALNGPVNFSVFPDLGLVADKVDLSTPDNRFSLSAEKIIAGVKLSSVFSGQVEITGLEIRQPELFVDSSIPVETDKAESKPQDDGESDIFADAVNTLESLALNHLSILDGKFTTVAADGSENVISAINAELSAPSLDGQMKLTFNALNNGQKLSLSATLAALRPILQRKPSGIDIALKMDPPPHPAMADLTLTGVILLAEDGSYQISNGQFSTLGQPLRLDAIYQPGARPYASLNLQADSVDLGTIKQAVAATGDEPSKAAIKTSSTSPSEPPDLSALRDFDGDLSVAIGSFTMDGAKISNIDLRAALNKGELKVKLGNATVANGKITAGIATNLADAVPTVRGSVSASSLALSNIARLANTNLPLDGNLGLNLGYAFRGMSEKEIKDSFNIAGTIALSKGTISIPALAGAGLGRTAGTISRLNVNAKIDNIQKPISVTGNMAWLGEVINFNTRVSPQSFVRKNNGSVALTVSSSKLKAEFNGNLNLNGAINGKANISTASLGALMNWLGQGANPDLKDFAYSGNVSVDANNFKFDKAKITLNGNRANGSGSFKFSGKPSITSNLSFGNLDVAALSGGSSGESKKSSGSSDTPLDLSALRGFNADIKLRAKQLIFGKVKAGPVQTNLTVKDGIARFSLPKTGFYNGNVAAEIVANGAGEVPAISIDAKLAGVDGATLLRDAAEFKRMEGTLNASISTKGTGNTTKTFAKSLNGKASAKFTNGAIKGIDVAKIYNNLALVLASGFKENSEDRTEFAELGLSFAIEGGVATTKDIKFIGPVVHMDGAGNVDLGEESIDMRLNPKLVGINASKEVRQNLDALQIPIIVKGPLSGPKVIPDLSEIIKNPQVALNALSKLGLNIKNLGGGLGGGGLDIAKIAKDKLNLDKLNNPQVEKQIGNVIESLVPALSGDTKNDPKNVVGSLLGSLTNPNATAPQPEAQTTGTDGDNVGTSNGTIAIPTPNPRKRAGTAQQQITAPSQSKEVKELVNDAINPKTEDQRKARDKQINNLLKKLF